MKKHGRIFRAVFSSIITLSVTTLFTTGCDTLPGTPTIPGGQIPGGGNTGGGNNPTPTPVATASPGATATPAQTGGGTGPSLAGALGIQDSVDMRAHDGPVVSQFGGTCSDFATAAAMDNVLHAKGINKLVSERHLWSLYGVYDADAAVQAATDNFVSEEQYWPIDGNASSDIANHEDIKITQSKPHQYDMNAALQGLSQGHPTVMAIQVPSSLANCDATVDANSAYTKGQHVMEAVGYKLDDSVSGGGYFILKNSWGPDCGDHGYHYYPFALCKRSDLYCYFIEIVDVQ